MIEEEPFAAAMMDLITNGLRCMEALLFPLSFPIAFGRRFCYILSSSRVYSHYQLLTQLLRLLSRITDQDYPYPRCCHWRFCLRPQRGLRSPFHGPRRCRRLRKVRRRTFRQRSQEGHLLRLGPQRTPHGTKLQPLRDLGWKQPRCQWNLPW
jgi:hypothetical protein